VNSGQGGYPPTGGQWPGDGSGGTPYGGHDPYSDPYDQGSYGTQPHAYGTPYGQTPSYDSRDDGKPAAASSPSASASPGGATPPAADGGANHIALITPQSDSAADLAGTTLDLRHAAEH
jgi:hypothetical protein